MKKNRFLGFLILTAVIQLLLCGNVFAKTVSKVIALKPKVTVSQRKDNKKKTASGTNVTEYYYMADAPSEGYFTVTVKKGTSKSNAQIKIYTEPRSCIGKYEGKKGVVRVLPVSKGALYFRAASGNSIKYTFTKVVQKEENYCKAKALPLKRGKKVFVCQTPKYNFIRWFKIKLPKKQKITLYCTGKSHMSIVDTSLNSVYSSEVSTSDKEWTVERTDKKMPKGTYYIRVYSALTLYFDSSGYYASTLYWK